MTAPTANTLFVSDGRIGIDISNVDSACKYMPNQTHIGAQGSEWVYVLAGAALNKGAMVAINGSGVATGVTGAGISTASSTLSQRYGFVQTAFLASQWGFVAVRGSKVVVRVQGTVSQNSPLFTTDTTGELGASTATASQFQIFGVVLESTASASGTSATVSTANISFPVLRKPKAGS